MTAEVRLGFREARLAMNSEAGKSPPATPLGLRQPGPLARNLAASSSALEAPRQGNASTTVETSATTVPPVSDTPQTRWRIHDMSSKGIGLIVDRATGDRISVGQLLAVKPDGFAYFMLGVIVRKLTQRTQDTQGDTLLGVEMLSYRPLPMTLSIAIQMPAMPCPTQVIRPFRRFTCRGATRMENPTHGSRREDFGLKNVFSLPRKPIIFGFASIAYCAREAIGSGCDLK
ncbi:MAG: hypothetical protein IPP88_22855 [Betaproteobacteria bacterium]|nr:hypothetical protein [Betaproteobacteria bacterium]